MKSPAIGLAQNFQRDVNIEGRPLPNSLPDWPPFIGSRICWRADSSTPRPRPSPFGAQFSIRSYPCRASSFYLHDDYLLMHGLIHGDVANIPRILGYHRMHGTNNST